MTKDEANLARCCGPSDCGSAHNDGPGGQGRYCIGATCMAWRWSEPKRTAAFLEAVQKHMQAQDKPNFNTAAQAVFAETGGQFERSEGHCGLAGSPQ